MAPSALPGNESAPSPPAAAASGSVGPIAPAACHKSSNGRDPRLATAAPDNVPWRSGSSTKPSAAGTLPMARASRLSPSGRLSPSVPISARPVADPSRRASAAGERSSGSANSTSIAIAAGRPIATASTSRAIVSRGHGQVPNASMEARSMSTTMTFRSDGAGLRSHWSPASSMSKALSRSTSLVVLGSRMTAARKAVSVAVPAATGRRNFNARRILPIEIPPSAGQCSSNIEAGGLARSADACERGADAFRCPSLNRRRWCARRDNISTFALAQDHLLPSRGHRHRAADDEHAEAPVARTGEESRTAYRDQREGAANLHCCARAARRPIEQQRPGAQRHLPASIDKKPIDLQPSLFAKPDPRIAAEPHSQFGRDAGNDFVAEKDRRGAIERAATPIELGECLTLDLLNRADPLGGVRRYTGKDEWERQRSVAEKPASIAGPVAFDLAEVGHRRSPSAWCSREQCLSLSRLPAEHSVTWVTRAQINGRDGTVLRRRRSAVDKYNELPAF